MKFTDPEADQQSQEEGHPRHQTPGCRPTAPHTAILILRARRARAVSRGDARKRKLRQDQEDAEYLARYKSIDM